MNKTSYAALVLSVGACFPVSPVLSDPEVVSKPITQYFDCDARLGHFSTWRSAVGQGSVRTSGKLEIKEIGRDSKWLPVGGVFIAGATPTSGVGFQVNVRWQNSPESAYISFFSFGDGAKREVYARVSSQ